MKQSEVTVWYSFTECEMLSQFILTWLSNGCAKWSDNGFELDSYYFLLSFISCTYHSCRGLGPDNGTFAILCYVKFSSLIEFFLFF